MKKYLSAIFSSTLLVLPLLLTSLASPARELTNEVSRKGTAYLDNITSESRHDWSCWETDPTPNLSLFEGSYCGVIKIAPATDFDGWVGVITAYDKGFSAIGRFITAYFDRTPHDGNMFKGVKITYDRSAFGTYQLELIDNESWQYLSIADYSQENCGDGENFCTLTSFPDFSNYHGTEMQIYVRAVVFGTKGHRAGLTLKTLNLGWSFTSPYAIQYGWHP